MNTPVGKAEAKRRLTGRPWKAKPCTKINSGIGSNSYWLIYLIYPSLD
ncbi:hypothetical protein [Priestia megaterium]|nr:hypothetical protein [Priestia megaterium]MCM3183117.1 hypothetical protein [Priestia megaterium]